MPARDFRCVHLPYCIKQLPNGDHVVLNRDYKPLGFHHCGHVEYEAYPIGVKFRGLTGRVAGKLSWKGDPNTKEIFLYSDECIPTVSAPHMQSYLERIRILAKLRFAEEKL